MGNTVDNTLLMCADCPHQGEQRLSARIVPHCCTPATVNHALVIQITTARAGIHPGCMRHLPPDGLGALPRSRPVGGPRPLAWWDLFAGTQAEAPAVHLPLARAPAALRHHTSFCAKQYSEGRRCRIASVGCEVTISGGRTSLLPLRTPCPPTSSPAGPDVTPRPP